VAGKDLSRQRKTVVLAQQCPLSSCQCLPMATINTLAVTLFYKHHNLLSASPEGEARLPMPKGMAYKE
jgi:hypothetical protein